MNNQTNEIFNKWRFNGKFHKHNPIKKYNPEFLDALQWCDENGVRIFQNYDELYLLWEKIYGARNRIKGFIEIGAADGGSLYVLSQALNPNATIFSIDFIGGQGGDIACREKLMIVVRELMRQNRKVYFILGKSEDEETKKTFKQYASMVHIDLLFIDGGHRYEDAKHDYEYYGKYVRRGGLIAIHDISSVCESWIEVHKFWSDLITEPEINYEEFQTENIIGGIGVIYK